MTLVKLSLSPSRDVAESQQLAVALTAAASWLAAAITIAPRFYFVGDYSVLQLDRSGWGLSTISPSAMIVSTVVSIALFLGVRRFDSKLAVGCLLATGILPALQFVRTLGFEAPVTFIEPFAFIVCTGIAVHAIAQRVCIDEDAERRVQSVPFIWLLTGIAVCFAAWWYFQASFAHDSYLFGFRDVGSFTRRIANTWSGRGFLRESPSVATHWDHFHPGLVVLVPLWGIWPSIKLIFLLHGLALAAPAICVFGIARRLEASKPAAFAWAIAYLAFPAVGQFNLSYTYGWHPISFALPALFAMLWAVVSKRLWLALLCALAACSFKETAIVAVACLSASAGLSSWLAKHGDQRLEPFGILKPWHWLVASCCFAASFVIICKLSPFTDFQSGRFGELGGSTTELVLSPFTKPEMFFGELFKTRSWFYVLALLIPLQFRPLMRGWPIALAVVPSLVVVLAMDGAPATCFGCHYATTLVPTLFLAAMIGSRSMPSESRCIRPGTDSALVSAGLATCVSCIVASLYYGSVAWSNESMRRAEFGTYHNIGELNVAADRRPGSSGHELLERMTAELGGPTSRVICTGKLYSHLLGVERLECISEIEGRWSALEREAGHDKSPMDLFDWIIIDTREFFHQSPRLIGIVLDEAKEVGFQPVFQDRGIVLLRHPSFRASAEVALR